jgi:hypothetical protein
VVSGWGWSELGRWSLVGGAGRWVCKYKFGARVLRVCEIDRGLSVFRVLQRHVKCVTLMMQSTAVELRCHVEFRDNLAWKARGDVTLLRIPQDRDLCKESNQA